MTEYEEIFGHLNEKGDWEKVQVKNPYSPLLKLYYIQKSCIILREC